MKASEFLPESCGPMPMWLQHATGYDSGEVKVNPGQRVGSDGKYKWSPPLQQQLDLVKDIAGGSDDAISVDDCESDVDDIGDDIKAVLAVTLNHGLM